jgi:hypothetical protein
MKIFGMNKGTAMAGTAVIAIALLLSGNAVYAKTEGNVHGSAKVSLMGSLFTRLHVNKNGKAVISGSVQAVQTDGFTISTWGGVWTVKTTADTKYSFKGTLSNVVVGDQVLVNGTAATSSQTIIAKHIEDKTFKQTKKEDRKDRNEIRFNAQVVLRGGSVATTSSSSFDLVNGASTTTVNTDTNTKYYGMHWAPISFTDIKTGHNVNVYGTTTGTTSVTASLIHDLSI